MEKNENIRKRNINEGHKKDLSSKIVEDKGTSSNEETKETIYLRSFNDSYASLKPEKSSYHLTRIILLRFLAFIYGLNFILYWFLV